MKYFYPDGTEITGKKDFVEYYSNFYFYFEKIHTENEILKLLKKSDNYFEKDEIIKILCWKADAKEPSENEDRYIKARHRIYLNEIPNIISWEKDIDNDSLAVDFLNKSIKLNDGKGIGGVGSVYMITLLFFASKGKYPIYDKFADLALYAIDKGIKPHTIISYEYLPGKKEISFELLENKKQTIKNNYWKRYRNDYCKCLEEIASDLNVEYIGAEEEFRKLDRALWVYGHMYS